MLRWRTALLTGSFPSDNWIVLPLFTHLIISSITSSLKVKLRASACTLGLVALCGLPNDKPAAGTARTGIWRDWMAGECASCGVLLFFAAGRGRWRFRTAVLFSQTMDSGRHIHVDHQCRAGDERGKR
jgi:hypothetical protein